MSIRTDPVEVRFWDKVNKTETCWLWTGSTYVTGYGQIRINKKLYRAHRWSYEQAYGPIPEGLHLDHLCRNRLCVRPDHLEAVTQQENNRRSWAVRPPKTHCPRGHAYTEDNIYWERRSEGRDRYHCKTCTKARAA